MGCVFKKASHPGHEWDELHRGNIILFSPGP
jgi:hypothetical protein